MFTVQLTEIINAEWQTKPISCLKPTLKTLRRTLTKSFIPEKRLLEKELGSLCKMRKELHINMLDDLTPVTGGIICSLNEISEEAVISCISRVSAVKYLTSTDIDTMIWQAKLCLIKSAVISGSGFENNDCAEKLSKLTNLDAAELCAKLNPLDRLYSEDKLYNELTADTRALYRKMTAEISLATGIDEARLSKEYLTHSINSERSSEYKSRGDKHIGETIMNDYRRVFPLIKLRYYLTSFFVISFSAGILLSCLTVWWAIFFVLPVTAAIIKPAIDYIITRIVRITPVVPSLELHGKIPDYAKTLCVISTILSSENDVKTGYEKLCSVKLRNRAANIKFALLCDLKGAKTETCEGDDAIIAAAKLVFDEEEDFVILIRKRRFSKTQNQWQGHERKRGAILSLVGLLKRGSYNSDDFSAVFGKNHKKTLKNIKYIAALDFDTQPLMDSISELVGIALHPFHRDKGIIAPRITTTLQSYLRSGFSRAMSGNGGCAGASAYDSFTGEMYQDCFGEGIFTGKGLIDTDIFAARYIGMFQDGKFEKRFPDERILSHDILEGGCTGVVFAGGTEFSDSFPDTSNAFFKRNHRWLRGDLQNFRYIFDSGFSSLTRWKLADNVRRAVTPIFIMLCLFAAAAINSEILAASAALAIIMPFLMGFVPSVLRGRKFANYRRFYSPIISQTKQLLRQCLLEIMLAPKNALISFDALTRTVWRLCISKKHLLDWTTSAAFEGMKLGFKHMLLPELLSFILFFSAAANQNITTLILGIIFIAALPVAVFADRIKGSPAPALTAPMKEELTKNARKMWRFYEDFITEEFGFLPPDNVQYSPVYRVSPRTSPTNIGMYLLSAVSAKLFDFIDNEGLELRIKRTISTIEQLEKWHGNLMNWYDICAEKQFKVISPFVSSVDSGNFVCCLITLKEALKEFGCDENLIYRIEKLASETDLKPFYNKSRRLFSIGYDVSRNELSHHNYDLIMSESRMLSYYAIATGQVDKSHWRALGRVMGKDGHYAAPVAWTGTMFEYFMPELLLKSKEGSMEYEALRFSLHCQQKRGAEAGLPFGISESGYYAFDEELNYQYKAHGVQTVGLKADLNKEYVISPYSSFLSLAYDPIASYNNLARLEKLGVSHSDYGFYEAVDFTKKRVGSGHAVIKSHMAHHVGMSICGIANTLFDGKIQDFFHADEYMQRAEELLEEKIIAGETVLGPPEFQKEEEHRMNAREFTEFSLRQLKANPLSNGKLTVICTDIGITDTFFEHKSMMLRTADLLRPRGSLFAFTEGDFVMPFFWHPTLPDEVCEAEQSVLFMQNSTEYYRNFRNLRLGMQLFLHSDKPVEIRKFAAKNTSGIKRQITLSAYIEPALAHSRDIEAHPAFMDLFLKVRYDEENKLFIASRKSRLGEDMTVMAAGFANEEDFTFSLNREAVISRNGGIFSSMEKAKERETFTNSVPCPCIFIKADFPLDAYGKKEAELFVCYGKSGDEVLALSKEIRRISNKKPLLPPEEITSPLVHDTIYGRLTQRVLPHILYTPDVNKKAVMKNKRGIKTLWRFGISGDRPVVLFEFKGKASGADGIIQMKKALSLCQIEFDLVILFESGSQKKLIEQLRAEINTELFLIGKDSLDDTVLNLLRSTAVSTIFSDNLMSETPKPEPAYYLPLFCSDKPETNKQNRFEGDEYIIENSPELPWCNVLASTEFGTLVSDRSLGFSWALNSRENKLTPWFNDLRSDNCGEMLVMKLGGSLYDLIDGSLVKFAPNRADYHGIVKGLHAKTSISIFSKGMGKKITINLENRSRKSRTISLAYYAEPVMGVNRERARLIKPSVFENTLIFKTCANSSLSGAMTLTCNTRAEFITDREDFWCGKWSGGAEDSIKPAFDLIGAVIVRLELPPKHNETVEFFMTFTKNSAEPLSMQEILIKKGFEAPMIMAGDIKTGDERLDALYKYWLPWQTIGCRMRARTGFYQNSGAFGFRDQLQDAVSIIKLCPEIAMRQIARACAAQFAEGDVLHWWHDLTGIKKGVRTRYSDDLLWLPFALSEYIAKTHDREFLYKEIYYAEGELLNDGEHEKYIEVVCGCIKESVYLHAKRAMEKAYMRGNNDLLLMGSGDWCDGYNTVGAGGKGESVWLAMFYAWTARKMANLAFFCGDELYAQKLEIRADDLLAAVDKNAWDGKYYLRAFYDNGRKMGASENDQCVIDLLPQAFCVLAKMPDDSRKLEALTKAAETLVDYHHRIIKLFTPPFKYGKTWQTPGYVMSYPEGVRENGGQYTHAAVWLALACHEAGLTELAEKLAHLLSPFGRGEEYKTEPYYMSADIYTNPEAYGRGGWSIYTGSAGWYFTLLGELYK